MPPTMVVPAAVAEARISSGQRRLPLYKPGSCTDMAGDELAAADHVSLLGYRARPSDVDLLTDYDIPDNC